MEYVSQGVNMMWLGIKAVSCSEFWWRIYHFIICKCHKLLFNHRDLY